MATEPTKQATDPSPLFLRGSLYRNRRKCGRKGCRCGEGALHECWALSVKVDGKTQMITLPDEHVPRIQEAMKRYEEATTDLERRVLESLDELRSQLGRKRRSPRGSGSRKKKGGQ